MNRRRTPRSASAEDLLSTLQHLTARAREEVELHQARVELAQALQRKMLPATLPVFPGLETAARYAPARDGLDIGGDWYDGFVLPDGALGLAIGDVQGHDVEAAAFMGQIRIAMRAIASSAADPGEVMSRTNDLILSMDSDLFATCSFLRLDPLTRELWSARAGHVASVWATADGRSGVTADSRRAPARHSAAPALPGHPARSGRHRCICPAHRRSHRRAVALGRRRAGPDQASGECPRDHAAPRSSRTGSSRPRGSQAMRTTRPCSFCATATRPRARGEAVPGRACHKGPAVMSGVL